MIERKYTNTLFDTMFVIKINLIKMYLLENKRHSIIERITLKHK